MMRFKQIKELVIVDLLQTNRQTNNSGNKKPIDKENLRNRMILQNLLFLVIYGSFFGTTVMDVPLPEFPGMFTSSLGFMALFIVLQMFQLIFNLFYPNTSLSEYLSLPFSLRELFVSKLITILLSTLSFFIIPIVLFAMLGWQAGHSLFWVIPVAFVLSITIMAAIILVIFTFIHLLHQIPFFIKHKRTMSVAIYILLFITLFYFIFTNNEPVEYGLTGIIDSEPNRLFIGFHQVFIAGQMMTGWLKVGAWVLGVLLLTGVAFKWIIPDLYSDEKKEAPKSRKMKTKSDSLSTEISRSKWRVFVKYQLRQLHESAFIIQMIFTKLYFPIFFILPALIGGGAVDASFLSELSNFWGIYMLAGALFAVLIVGEVTVGGIIISFDKENYHYIHSLPVPFRQYMQFKFWFAFAIELLLGSIILGGAALLVRLPLAVTFFVLLGHALGTFVATLYYFMRDYRLLNLTWSNFTELQQRGMNQFMRAMLNILLVFVGVFLTIGLSFWLIIQVNQWVVIGISTLIGLLLIGATIGIYAYSKKTFWVQFNQ